MAKVRSHSIYLHSGKGEITQYRPTQLRLAMVRSHSIDLHSGKGEITQYRPTQLRVAKVRSHSTDIHSSEQQLTQYRLKQLRVRKVRFYIQSSKQKRLDHIVQTCTAQNSKAPRKFKAKMKSHQADQQSSEKW